MLIQNKTNSNTFPAFGGKVMIMPGDLSYKPAKYARKAYNTMTSMVKDKPYNLYIRQNHEENTISVIAQKEKDLLKNRGIKTEGIFSASSDLYKEAASGAVTSYEKLSDNTTKSFMKRIINYFGKTEFKFKIQKKSKSE